MSELVIGAGSINVLRNKGLVPDGSVHIKEIDMKLANILLAGGLALFLGGAAIAHEQGDKTDMKDMKGMKGMHMDEESDAGKPVTLKGEVLDMDCYMNEGAHGKDHASCAVMCLNEDAPVGLLADDGKAYFLTANEDKGMIKHYQAVRGWGGERAEISGHIQVRNGLTCLRVDAAKKI